MVLRSDQNGFTLVELLVAMAISSIMLAVILVTYQSQAQTHITQQEVVDMQQNARAALDLMTREIRMAGLDPTGNAGAGILSATSNSIQFSMDTHGGETDSVDNNKNGRTDEPEEWYDGATDDPDEQVTYQLNGNSLQRVSNVTGNVADNIEVLNFVYLDANGAVIPAPVSSANLSNIRSIQVTLIARADNPVMMRKQTDSTIYTNQQGTVVLDKSTSPDTVRRIQLSAEIRCRNLGLNS